MEDKITINIPKGYEANQEPIENGVIIRFQERDIELEKIRFFKERINGCVINIIDDELSYEKDGEHLFQLKEIENEGICFYVYDNYLYEVLDKKFNTTSSDADLFIKNQIESIFKINIISINRQSI